MTTEALVIGAWAVESQSRKLHHHRVECAVKGGIGSLKCTCEAGVHGVACWHVRHCEELLVHKYLDAIQEAHALNLAERPHPTLRTVLIFLDPKTEGAQPLRIYLRSYHSQVLRYIMRAEIERAKGVS